MTIRILLALPLSLLVGQACAADVCAKPKDCVLPPTTGSIGFKDLLGNPHTLPFDPQAGEYYEVNNRAWDSTTARPRPPAGTDEGTYYKSGDSCYTTWSMDSAQGGITPKSLRGDKAILTTCAQPQG